MSPPSPAFDRLIAPLCAEEFFRTYWEQQPLHLQRQEPGYYRDTLTVNDVDRYFQSQHGSPQFIRVLKGGDYRPQEEWSSIVHGKGRNDTATQVIDLEKLLGLFDTGATIVVNSGEVAIPSLTEFSGALGRELKCHVQTNLYITPPRSQGFAPHFDAHNVFILQIHGHKRWSLHDVPVKAPVHVTPVDRSQYEDRQPQHSIELHAGDLLYVPRGTVHSARAEETASVHITVGPMIHHWSTLLRKLAQKADESPDFRRLLPHGLSDAQEREDFTAAFGRQLQGLLAGIDLPALHNSDPVKKPRIDTRNRFTDLLGVEQLKLDSVVVRRPSLQYLIDRKGQWIILRFESESLSLPVFLAPALSTLCQDEPFAVHTIAGIPNTNGKLALVRRFVRAGFLTVVSV